MTHTNLIAFTAATLLVTGCDPLQPAQMSLEREALVFELTKTFKEVCEAKKIPLPLSLQGKFDGKLNWLFVSDSESELQRWKDSRLTVCFDARVDTQINRQNNALAFLWGSHADGYILAVSSSRHFSIESANEKIQERPTAAVSWHGFPISPKYEGFQPNKVYASIFIPGGNNSPGHYEWRLARPAEIRLLELQDLSAK